MCWTALYSLTYPATPSEASVAHFVGAGDGAAENQNRQPPIVELADAAHEIDARCVRQPEIDDEQIELRQICTHAREQLGGAFDRDGAVTCALDRGLEAVPHEGRVIGNRARSWRSMRQLSACVVIPPDVSEWTASKALACVAELIRFSL